MNEPPGADARSDSSASQPVRYAEIVILVGILLIAAWLRFTGLDWGKNLYLHPDERFQTMVVTGIDWPASIGDYFDSANSPLNPYNRNFGSYVYGTFPLFLSKLIGTITGQTVYGNAHLPGRALSATCDLGTILLIYLIGRRLFGYRTALLAAALGSVTVLQIQSAHYFTSDSALVLCCAAAFYFAIRATDDGGWWHVASGLAVALAAASKINAVPIVAVLGLPVFEQWRTTGFRSVMRFRDESRLSPLGGAAVAVIAAVWTFRIAQPYAFMGPSPFSFALDPRWLNDLRYWREVQAGVGDSPPSMQWADRTPVLFSLRNLVLWGMGPLLGLTSLLALALAGLKLLAARRLPPGWQLILVGWPAFHLLYYGSSFVQTMRYMLPAYPFLALLAAALLIRIADLGTERGWGSIALGRRHALPRGAIPAAIVLIGTTLYAVGFTGIYTRTTTREAASRWIYANVEPGSVIASEHWDDAIPVSLPGFNTQQYPGVQLELFFPDDAAKLTTVLDRLSQADYIVVTSNRLYGTIPRIPERYPMTSEYYRMLFSGDLGFDLVHTETSYPTYAGFELNDDAAEEAFTVYDHPKVFVFRKSDRFDLGAVTSRLTSALGNGGYAIWPSVAGENLLMLDDAARSEQQASGTWRRMFDPGSLSNRFPVILWYLAVQLMALAAVPFCWRLFPTLPDRGHAVAKTLGVLGSAYVAWILASFKVLAFGPDAVGLGIVIVGAVSAIALRDRFRAFVHDVRGRWRSVLFVEGMFLVCFLAAVSVRGHNPDLWERYRGGEKPMDFAYFNAVLRSVSFPAFDPWFAGGYLHYYYFGFVQWASVTRLTGIVPEVAYNLAIPTIFALLCLNVWAVAVALIAAIRPDLRSRGSWRLPALGVLAPLFVALVGNLDLVQRIGRGEFGYPAGPGSSRVGGIGDIVAGLWNVVMHHPARPPDIYWSATRIVPGTINEFPAFSLLFADLHAHVMAMPLASAALVLACQIALGSRDRSRPSTADDSVTHRLARPGAIFPSMISANGRAIRPILSRSRDTAGRFALEAGAAGFLASALYATNTWDFPTYLGLLVGAFAIREFLAVEWRISYRLLVRVGLWAIATVAAGRLFFWPFYTSFFPESGVVRQPERTPVASYLTIHGLFIVALAGFVALNLAQRLTMSRSVIQLPGTAGIVAEPAPISTGASTGRPTSAAGPGIMAAAVAVVLAGIWRDELSVVLVGALIIMALAGWTCRNDPGRLLVILFAATALALGLATEQVALKGDIGRMNTVFKLSLQAWMLFGIAAAVGSVIVWTSGERRSLPVRIWTVTLGVLVAGAAVYPIIAVPARTHDRFVPMPTMLNGMTYMNGAVYTDAPDGRPEVRFPLSNDLAAIDWLRANIDGSPVVLEATIPEYRWGSRVSIYTGLPTVLGWNWHETQQRPGFGMMLEERRTDVQRMLGETTSFDSIRPLLDKYHVRLIYVGDLERAYYDASALAKFEAAAQDGELSIIYRGPGVTIYEYPDVPG